jgi:hypothetical protein
MAGNGGVVKTLCQTTKKDITQDKGDENEKIIFFLKKT